MAEPGIQVLFDLILGIAAFACIFGIKITEKKIDAADAKAVEALKQIADYKLHVAENYTSLKRFEGFEDALFKKLDKIEEKLDGKQDKVMPKAP